MIKRPCGPWSQAMLDTLIHQLMDIRARIKAKR